MFAPRDIAARNTVRPSATADLADTSITVNGGGGNPPPPPEFGPSARTGDAEPPRSTTTEIPRPRDTTTTTRIPNQTHTDRVVSTPGSVTNSTHHAIHWGGVLKGVAIVTAVALAAVVAYAVVAPLVTGFVANTAIGGALGSAASAVWSGILWAGDMAVSGLLFGAHLIESAAVALFTNLFGTSVAGAVASGAAAAPAVGSAAGAIAGGAVLAVGTPVAVHALHTTPILDTVHTTSTTAPVITGMEDGGASAQHSASVAAAKTQLSTAPHDTSGHHTTEGHLGDMQDVPDLHEQMNSLKTASKLAHHASHEVSHEGSEPEAANGESATPERRARVALRNSARTSEAWAERVGQPRDKNQPAQRASQFSAQLADERAQLDAALGTPQIG